MYTRIDNLRTLPLYGSSIHFRVLIVTIVDLLSRRLPLDLCLRSVSKFAVYVVPPNLAYDSIIDTRPGVISRQ